MSNPTKAFIFTPNKHSSSVGVFDNGTFSMVVEVNKIKGKGSFGFCVDGNWNNSISRNSAEEAWKDATSYLGATIVIVDNKYLKTNYKELLNPYLTLKKEQRKLDREEKLIKQNIKEGKHYEI